MRAATILFLALFVSATCARAVWAEEPKDKEGFARRAALHAAAGRHAEAIADYDRVIELDPQAAPAYDARGSEHFMLGHIAESIADFDRYLELRPGEAARHWKRGISCYYAGRYQDGRRQFESYQTFDDNDVENAVWRYLCMAHSVGVKAARDAILLIRNDGRVPMMAVYALFAGRAQPDDVLAAARAGSPPEAAANARLFYAHLYLGLYHDAAGDAKSALAHLAKAVEHKVDHYMWNVADVHKRLLERGTAKPSASTQRGS